MINDKFRETLRDAGLTQVAAAERCGVSAQTIWRIQHGGTPRMSTRIQIMEALGLHAMSHVELFGPLPVMGRGREVALPPEELRAYIAATQKARRVGRILDGRCEDCGKVRGKRGGKTRCEDCRKAHNVIARDYERRKAADRRTA